MSSVARGRAMRGGLTKYVQSKRDAFRGSTNNSFDTNCRAMSIHGRRFGPIKLEGNKHI